MGGSFPVDLENDDDVRIAVEIRDRVRLGDQVLMLGVDLIIDIRIEPTEAVSAIGGSDIGADGECFHVFQVDDGAADGCAGGVDHNSPHGAQLRLMLPGQGGGGRDSEKQA